MKNLFLWLAFVPWLFMTVVYFLLGMSSDRAGAGMVMMGIQHFCMIPSIIWTAVFLYISSLHGRIDETKASNGKVVVSGGFDPVHIGHLRMMEEAKKLGKKLVVVVNNDNWIQAKKGKPFMPQEDRKEIIEGFGCVDEVVLTSHSENTTDMSICNELREIRPDVFANGGDRKSDNIPEYQLCDDLGIRMVFNIGGEKIRSSSELVKASETGS